MDVTVRPVEPADAEALWRIHSTPEVAARWDLPSEGFPLTDEPETTRFTIRVDGAIAGMVQYGEELEPRYRHAWIDIFVAAEFHGRGVGTAAVREVVRILIEERGHHRIVIDPAADNLPAIRAYEKAGFTAVGVTRQSEFDHRSGRWHDALYMELLADEWTRDPPPPDDADDENDFDDEIARQLGFG